MKYENRLKIQEYGIYAVVWLLVFLAPVALLFLRTGGDGSEAAWEWSDVFSFWKEVAPFLALFLIHNFAVAPLLTKRQRKASYIIFTFCLLVFFAAGQAVFNTRRPDRMGPPPGEMSERPPLPPDGFRGGDNQRPPELNGQSDGTEAGGQQRPEPPRGRPDDGGPGARQDNGRPDGPPDLGPKDDKMPSLSRLLMDEPAIVKTFIAFLLVGMNLGIKEYFRTLKNEKDNEELRRQHLEQELEYLRYQINPHFFMNTLNNIHALVDIDPEQAKNTIVELSRLMRYVLYDGSRPTIPLAKEVEFLQHYIALMRLRYTDSVRIEVDMPDEVPDVQVPPLLCISFVENAFKHGISYEAESFIMVSLNVRDGYLTFSCINSKHAANRDPHSGIGLENTRKRLGLLYRDDYTFNINENNKTYEVLLKIPVTYDQVSGH